MTQVLKESVFDRSFFIDFSKIDRESLFSLSL